MKKAVFMEKNWICVYIKYELGEHEERVDFFYMLKGG